MGDDDRMPSKSNDDIGAVCVGPVSKKPRLQKGPNVDKINLLCIGGDALSHAVAYLKVPELCNSEKACRSLRQAAAPILDALVDAMHRDCLGKVPSVGEGSRTKLLRYLNALELAERVRDGLADHVAQIHAHGAVPFHWEFHPPKCRGCSSFPEILDMRHFFIPGGWADIQTKPDPEYEFFFYCFDNNTQEPLFQGVLPMHQVQNSYDYLFDVGDVTNTCSTWTLLKDLCDKTNLSDAARDLKGFVRSSFSIVAIAIHKKEGTPHFFGAVRDFGAILRDGSKECARTRGKFFVQLRTHNRVQCEHQCEDVRIMLNFDFDEKSLFFRFEFDRFLGHV